MALIKHIAGRNGCIVEPAESGLCHHQCVISDDDARLPRLADILLDKAAAKMRAGRVNALATTIGQPADPAASDELGKPAREIAGHEIPGLACGDPASDQPEMSGRSPRPAHCRAERVLVIQQAEKILPPLADHDISPFDNRIGVKAVELAGDLGLQVAGVSRDPHGAVVLLRPEARGRDVAQRLSDTRPGFGEHRLRSVGVIARSKGGSDCRRVVALLRPPLGDSAEQLGEPRASLLGPYRFVSGRRLWGRLRPLIEPYPYTQPSRLPQCPRL